MNLYFVPNTRSTRPRWLLEELGVPYELVKLDPSKKENHSPEYLDIHPLGHVPALVDGQLKLFESAAICMYLADRFPEKKLAPPPGTPERGLYYQWLVFGMATLEPALVKVLTDNRATREGKPVDAKAAEDNRKRLHDVMKVLETRLHGRQFIVGDSLSAADVVVGSIVGWASMTGAIDDFPVLRAYAKELHARPAAKKAREA